MNLLTASELYLITLLSWPNIILLGVDSILDPILHTSMTHRGRMNVPIGSSDVDRKDLPEFEPVAEVVSRGPLDQDGMPYFIEHVYVSVWKKKLSEKRNKRYGSTLQH